MSQQTIEVENSKFPAFRIDLNDNLRAISSNQSGPGAPAGALGNSWWFDTVTQTINMNKGDLQQFIPMGYFNQTLNSYDIIDGTYLSGPGPSRTLGQLTTTTQAVWNDGTVDNETLISPAKLKATIISNGGGGGGGGAGGGGAAAWVNFNGDSASINAHHNIGDFKRTPGTNTGSYDLEFTTDLRIADYAIVSTVNSPIRGPYSTYFMSANIVYQDAGKCTITTGYGNELFNSGKVCLAFFDVV